ncbi:gastrula zinc finger protein XlCGF8.2DB-like isoform X2 [Bacillus rossius redtenbacheri]|uniref:gastrula zinc finger protein XlCGF8.2DB-like isoform X2 n=1 Tax=Bacillus rossius redtenbacheri TaxID=93214 RepID=UPI002FDE25FC
MEEYKLEHGFHQQLNSPTLLPLYSADKLCVKNEAAPDNRKDIKEGRSIEEIMNVGDNSEYARAMQRSDEALYNVRGIAVEGQHYMASSCVQRSCNMLQQAWHGFDAAELKTRLQGQLEMPKNNKKLSEAGTETERFVGMMDQSAEAGCSKKQFSCGMCLAKFEEKYMLTNHICTHVDSKPPLCAPHPPKSAAGRHAGEKPFCCPVCAAEFFSKSNLTRHMRMHNGDKGLTCTVCAAKFKQKEALRAHMCTHTGEKGFSCSLCSAKFTTKCEMTRHVCVYSGERPFVCSICSAKFGDKDSLRSHVYTHIRQKSYSCTLCTAKFTHKSELNDHTRTHGRLPFSCLVCTTKFARRCELERHLCSFVPSLPSTQS